MKKIIFLMLFPLLVKAQIQYTPDAITIGTNHNQSIPLRIETTDGGVVHQADNAILEIEHSTDNTVQNISVSASVLSFNHNRTLGATTFYTGDQERLRVSNSAITFKKKFIVDNEFILSNALLPFKFNGFSGLNGDLLYSTSSSAGWGSAPASHPKNAFSAFNATSLSIPQGTSPTFISGLTVDFDDSFGVDFIPSTGAYIAPNNGLYHFELHIPELVFSITPNFSARVTIVMLVNNNEVESLQKSVSGQNTLNMTFSSSTKLQAGDAVKFAIYNLNPDNFSANINSLIERRFKLTGYKIY